MYLDADTLLLAGTLAPLLSELNAQAGPVLMSPRPQLVMPKSRRATHKAPDLPLDVGEFSRRTSFAVHHLLYVLMLLVPVVGVVARVWHGRPFDYGLFQLNFGVASNPAVFHPAEKIHQLLAYALFALAGAHIAGALYHHFVRRDGVLLRMMPGGTG